MIRTSMKSRPARGLAVVLLALLGGAAHAVDGVVLIDQNRALAGGVTPGDTAGFPVTISQPGSYRLSSNLTVPDANTSAIVIAPDVSGVTIDLNGFAILGPTICTGFPLTCAPTGSGSAVSAPSGAGRGVAVRNGTVSGMGSTGLAIFAAGAVVDNVTVTSNGGTGIFVVLGTVTNNRVMKNGGSGITASNALINHNFVSQNGGTGISANDSLITQNVLIVNGSVGVAAANSAFSNNQFSSNNGGFLNPQFSGRGAIGPNGCDGSTCP